MRIEVAGCHFDIRLTRDEAMWLLSDRALEGPRKDLFDRLRDAWHEPDGAIFERRASKPREPEVREHHPVCATPTADGEPCQRRVMFVGHSCWQHRESSA
jgi:hypothetical protein